MKTLSACKNLALLSLVLSAGLLFGMEGGEDWEKEDLKPIEQLFNEPITGLPNEVIEKIELYLNEAEDAQFLEVLASSQGFRKSRKDMINTLKDIRLRKDIRLSHEMGLKLLSKIKELELANFEEDVIRKIEEEIITLINKGADLSVRAKCMRVEDEESGKLLCSESSLDGPLPTIPDKPNVKTTYFNDNTALLEILAIWERFYNCGLSAMYEKSMQKIVELLIEKGADINETEIQINDTPLILATMVGNLHLVKLILSKGAKINAKNNNDERAILRALHLEDESIALKIIDFLIASGADVNVQDDDEAYTPLCMAVSRNSKDLVKMLIKAKADPTLKNVYRQTAREIAVNEEYTDLADILADYEKQWAQEQVEKEMQSLCLSKEEE